MKMTGSEVQSLAVELTNDEQVVLYPDTRVFDRYGRSIALAEVPDALVDSTGWIEYETTASASCGDPECGNEPWMGAVDDEPSFKARARLYARGVICVVVLYAAAADE